jgi:hypothetical protein
MPCGETAHSSCAAPIWRNPSVFISDENDIQEARLKKANEESLEYLRKLATSADQLREIMRTRLSKDLLRPEDEQWALEFTEAKKRPYERFDGEAAAKYLEDLKKRADASH